MAAFFSRVVSPPIRGSITPALPDLYPEMPGSTDRCHLIRNSMLYAVSGHARVSAKGTSFQKFQRKGVGMTCLE